MIEFECPKCGKAISATDSNVGESIICPFCNAGVRPPPAAEAARRLGRLLSSKRFIAAGFGWALSVVGFLSMLIGLVMIVGGGAAAITGCLPFVGGWLMMAAGVIIERLTRINNWLVTLSDQLAER